MSDPCGGAEKGRDGCTCDPPLGHPAVDWRDEVADIMAPLAYWRFVDYMDSCDPPFVRG